MAKGTDDRDGGQKMTVFGGVVAVHGGDREGVVKEIMWWWW